MILCIANILTPDELRRIGEALKDAEFVDGRTTAGWHAKLVKENQQLSGGDEASKDLKRIVMVALARNDVFRSAVMPRTIKPPMFNRYADGMTYGSHVDDALMRAEAVMRSDVSYTVFLGEPESYDGGELVIESTGGEQPYKLAAGSALLYPATTLHRVAPVTRGARLAAVGWVQSLVRDPAQREILFDLDVSRREVFEKEGKTRAFDLLSKSHANLLRMWAEV